MNNPVNVFAFYMGFPEIDRDDEAKEIFERFGGKSVGAGCWVGGERDIQYRVERSKVQPLIDQLKAAEFRAEQSEAYNG